jgi:Domain of unknown function (DUF6438)
VTRVSAVLLLGLLSCAPRKTVTPPASDSIAQSSVPPAITLERTACFGGCPVYTLAVSPSGEITYQGKAHVRQLGTATGKIPQQQVDALLAELNRAGYFSFASRYASTEPACGRYATDSPTVISSVTLRGRTKRIEHDYGCGSAPGALVVLERRIDEALGSSHWTGR